METKLDRNNTNFPMQLFEFFKSSMEKSEYAFLKYYQELIRKYTMNVNLDSRGLLIKLQMGLGKSMLAIAILMDMIKDRQCIILLAKSLEDNMIGTIHKYAKLRAAEDPLWPLGRLSPSDLDTWIKKNISFVSMNASNMLGQVQKVAVSVDDILDKKIAEVNKLPNLNGKLLIVDEAHNLFRAITNGSQNAIGLYNSIISSDDLKVLFLTGTPIANDPFELVPCFNMIGSSRPNILTFPEEYSTFYKLYVDADGTIKNRGKFQNRIMGLVSSVNKNSTPGKGLSAQQTIDIEFPTLNEIQVVKVTMGDDQYAAYKLARDKELHEGTMPIGRKPKIIRSVPLVKPKSFATSSYRVRSRQLSNFSFPLGAKKLEDITNGDFSSPKFTAVYDNMEKHPGGLGIVYSQFVGLGGLGSFAKYLESRGWKMLNKGDVFNEAGEVAGTDVVETEVDEEHDTEQKNTDQVVKPKTGGSELPSVDEYLNDLASEKQSDWWTGGESTHVDVVHGGVDTAGVKTFAVISGNVPTIERNQIARMFTSEENIHGDLCGLLLISSTGAEGLDLKCIRHIHIMEPYWNWGRIEQIIYRGVRANSHILLDKASRDVTAYVYLAITPKPDEETTDTELYNESVKNKVGINSFNSAIDEVSIECSVNAEANCRLCSPNDKPLFSDDVERDIRVGDNCVKAVKSFAQVEEIETPDGKYYYSVSPESVYGYNVYYFDEKVNSYRLMHEYADIFPSIIEQIEKKMNP